MVLPTENSDNTRAVLRSEEASSAAMPIAPWSQEGEFEIDALIVSQSHGELLVKVDYGEKQNHLTIVGFLPGKVNGQTWKLTCIRESGKIELLDGEPI